MRQYFLKDFDKLSSKSFTSHHNSKRRVFVWTYESYLKHLSLTVSLLGSRTWQSSTLANAGRSDMAIDGMSSDLFNTNTCFHTDHEPRPWWTVDLGRERTVFEVTLFHAEDSYGSLT